MVSIMLALGLALVAVIWRLIEKISSGLAGRKHVKSLPRSVAPEFSPMSLSLAHTMIRSFTVSSAKASRLKTLLSTDRSKKCSSCVIHSAARRTLMSSHDKPDKGYATADSRRRLVTRRVAQIEQPHEITSPS